MRISSQVEDNVAVVVFSNPPVNALSVSNGLVDGLLRELRRHQQDPAVRALVLQGDGQRFCGGADIAELGDDPAIPKTIRTLIAAVEACAKPVVAALDGVALGGGLELALACHHRVCTATTRFGFPEVTLGLLPGSGGTQRLPRLVGAAAALDLMLSGRSVSAEEARRLGLVDEIAPDDPVGPARAAALGLAKGGFSRLSERAVPKTDGPRLLADARHAAERRPSARLAAGFIIDCVEAAMTESFEMALQQEAKLFDELMRSDASRGLRHCFFGERTVARIPGLPPDLEEFAIGRVAIVGAGTMGPGIALCMLNAGLPTILVDRSSAALDAAVARIGQTYARDVEKGRLAASEAAARQARLTPATDLGSAADADLVVEAVFEDMGVKREVFEALDRSAKAGAILASNTSTLDLNAIAGFTGRPDRVIGMHFFSPANIMRLLEVVRGVATAPAVLASIMRFARRIGKIGVVAGVCDGFIGNRLFEEYLRQAYFLLEEGALPQQVDGALERWGMAMGPFRVMDLAGQDIGWSIRKRRALEHPDRPYSPLPDRICEMGRFGQKAGAGFYLYPDGRTPVVDPQIDDLVVRHSATIGMSRRSIGDDEIIDRCVLALTNEGAKTVAEGIAYRPVDIDVIYINGYGFGAERGGPMFHADTIGLRTVLQRMADFERGYQGWAWRPADLLARLAASDASFGTLNG